MPARELSRGVSAQLGSIFRLKSAYLKKYFLEEVHEIILPKHLKFRHKSLLFIFVDILTYSLHLHPFQPTKDEFQYNFLKVY